MLEWEKVVRNIVLKFLVKILFIVKLNYKKFYLYVKDVVCFMCLGNCCLFWKMLFVVMGVNIIINRKYVVYCDIRWGFFSWYVFVLNNFDIYKILFKSFKNIFNVDSIISNRD